MVFSPLQLKLPDEEANRRKGPQQLFPTVYTSEINRIGLRYTTAHHDGNSPHYLHQRPPHHAIARPAPFSIPSRLSVRSAMSTRLNARTSSISPRIARPRARLLSGLSRRLQVNEHTGNGYKWARVPSV